MTQMRIVYLLTVFSLLTGLLIAEPASPDAVVPDTTVQEGFFLDGVEGLLIQDSSADTWSFVPDAVVEVTKNKHIPAGERLELLPCSVLEQMTGLVGKEQKMRLRYWGLFTKYNGKNHLFSVYFMPLEETPAKPEKPAAEEEKEPAEEPKTDSIIPTEILKQIKSNAAPDLKKFQQVALVSGDTNLIGRSGYLVMRDGVEVFHPDGLGMKINSREFFLLPNTMLQDAEGQMALTPGKQRYTVSGLVTQYKGKTYMLIRRAVRTYTNGNFSD